MRGPLLLLGVLPLLSVGTHAAIAVKLPPLNEPRDLASLPDFPKDQVGPQVPTKPAVPHLNADTFPSPRTLDVPAMHIINFYSPRCIHCKRFEPTYIQIFTYLRPLRKHRVYVEMVDCLKDTEVCEDHDIKGTPTVKAVWGDAKGGSQDKEMPLGTRTFPEVMRWIRDMAKQYVAQIGEGEKVEKPAPVGKVEVQVPVDQVKQTKPITKPVAEVKQEPIKDVSKDVSKEEPVEEHATKETPESSAELETLRNTISMFTSLDLVNPNGEVTIVNDDSFGSYLEESIPAFDYSMPLTQSSERAGVTLFHSPLCPHCVAFQPTYRDLAKDLKNHLGAYSLAVPANPAVSSSFNIEYFPTLYFLRGGHRWGWNLDRGLAGLSRYSLEFAKFDVGEIHSTIGLEQARENQEVFSVLLMNESDDEAVLKAYLTAVEGTYLHVKPYLSFNRDILPLVSRPSVAVLRKDDFDSPYTKAVGANQVPPQQIMDFILTYRRGLVTQLTPWNLSEMLSAKQLVFALLNPEGHPDEYRDLRRIAKDVRAKHKQPSNDWKPISIDKNGVVSGGDVPDVQVIYLNPSLGGYKAVLKGFYPTALMGNGSLKIPIPFIGVVEYRDGKVFDMQHGQEDAEEGDKGKMLWSKGAVLHRLEEVQAKTAEGKDLDHRFRMPHFTTHVGIIIASPILLYLAIYKLLPWVKGKRGYGRLSSSPSDGGFRKFE